MASAPSWELRDLPVLKAAVEFNVETDRAPSPRLLERATGFDRDTVRRALRALHCEPFFVGTTTKANGEVDYLGKPTGAALRVTKKWPSPEGQLAQLIAAFEAVAADESQPAEKRSRAATMALWASSMFSDLLCTIVGGVGADNDHRRLKPVVQLLSQLSQSPHVLSVGSPVG
ncbi:hypothetical protein [Mycobacterium sp. 236(2023)]|uniref:hypothetical protein n=1 Tax=Mycobacterium sp. 236(2023) TaxID=3038163 RepID=UPI002414FD40|nr:hypothetical protein [Mycobacterium sp. 236(2023)]MDG4667964.1 hypothetical protein [Mycobacterium sp. 236(2023)]